MIALYIWLVVGALVTFVTWLTQQEDSSYLDLPASMTVLGKLFFFSIIGPVGWFCLFLSSLWLPGARSWIFKPTGDQRTQEQINNDYFNAYDKLMADMIKNVKNDSLGAYRSRKINAGRMPKEEKELVQHIERNIVLRK